MRLTEGTLVATHSSTSNAELHQRRTDVTPRGIGVMGDFFADRAVNCELWDIEGRRFIDFSSGIAVLNTGHCHPKLIAAIQTQLSRFSHTCFHVVPYEGYVRLAEELVRITPGRFDKKAALFTTGAEAVENAIKIARAATGRSAVIAFSGAFHGRTLLGMALTGKVAPYKTGFGPFPADVYHAAYPNALHEISVEDAVQSLEMLFKTSVEPGRTAAIIVEPIQGEGGFNVAPPEFMRAIRRICDKHGIVMIADEIQTGFARTGKMFAMDHYDVVPDLITLAKGLAGGMPLSAVCGRKELMDAPGPGGLGGTYAGNPVSVQSALTVLEIIGEEQLCRRAEDLGATMKEALHSVRGKVPQIADVRGLGSMIAIEFLHPETREPLPEFAQRVQKLALEKGLILLTCGVHGNVIRLLYPLTSPDDVFAEGLGILKSALTEAM
jgi:4-aminobutyrate aminotransferase